MCLVVVGVGVSVVVFPVVAVVSAFVVVAVLSSFALSWPFCHTRTITNKNDESPKYVSKFHDYKNILCDQKHSAIFYLVFLLPAEFSL